MSGANGQAVVFDLDGTLVNSMPLVLRGYAQALAPYHPPLDEARILALLGGPPDRFFRQLLPDATQATAALARLEEFFLEHAELIQPFAGAGELLDVLRAAGRRIGIWTGRERVSTEWILRRHGLATRIDAAVCGDDLPSHQPDPAGRQSGLARLGIAPGAALFVGDGDVDVLAGAASGVRTLLIRHGRRIRPAVQAKAWETVETPAEAFVRLRGELTAA